MLPELFIERMRRILADEFEPFLAAYDHPRNAALRLTPGKPAPAEFCADPVPWEPNAAYLKPGVRPGLHPLHDAGAYYLQEPSAMAPARLLDAHPGERVLDLCAAPGGKTTQLAAAMGGQGLLICNEIHPKRSRILSSNIERLGISNAVVLNEHPARLAERFVGYFDKILVDAPCSGEGMFRKEDAAVSDWSPETVAMCAQRQQEILSSAAQMLAPGGRLVYSTCTFAPEENEGVISRFLHTHNEFSVENISAPWFSPGRPDWIADPAPGLSGTFRLWPHKLRGEGHFAAVLRRSCAGERRETALEPPAILPQEIPSGLVPEGIPVCFGEKWFIAPQGLPALRGLHVLRVGLEVGEVRKGRFLPAHALSHWLTDYPVQVDFPSDSPEIAAYLRGETLPGTEKGWCIVAVDGVALGWAKGDGQTLKNHFPKGLRR